MVGNLAPPSKLTTVTTFDGKPPVEIPYARLPRIERLKVSGKVDDTEDHSGEDEVGVDAETKKMHKEEREKRKMRGKGKSLKRYLRKQRKNVIDPAAVCLRILTIMPKMLMILYQVAIRTKLERQKEEKKRAKAKAAGNGEKRQPSALDRFKKAR